MFKFDFDVGSDDQTEGILTEKEEQNCDNDGLITKLPCYESQEVLASQDNIEMLGYYKLNATFLNAGEHKIYYIKTGNIIKTLTKHDDDKLKDIKEAECNHTDLLPGIYEGGAKVWECTLDLISYLCEHFSLKNLRNKAVLDLGCGSGLLGLTALKAGAVVHFQDYNKDVLEAITVNNVLINIVDPVLDKLKNIKFYSGDWENYIKLTSTTDNGFDLILTSETIYNPDNYLKLLNTFESKLRPDGLILLAAKIYYFGVGGGIRQFENVIIQDGRFKSKVLWTSEKLGGISREILEIRRKIC